MKNVIVFVRERHVLMINTFMSKVYVHKITVRVKKTLYVRDFQIAFFRHMLNISCFSNMNFTSHWCNYRSEVEVPELSYGQNPRLPSVSTALDLQFSPDRGRYFVATRDMVPGASFTWGKIFIMIHFWWTLISRQTLLPSQRHPVERNFH